MLDDRGKFRIIFLEACLVLFGVNDGSTKSGNTGMCPRSSLVWKTADCRMIVKRGRGKP